MQYPGVTTINDVKYLEEKSMEEQKIKEKTKEKEPEKPLVCPPEGHILEPDGERLQLIKKGKKTYILIMDELLSELFAASHSGLAEQQAKYEKYVANLPKIKNLAKRDKKLRQLL